MFYSQSEHADDGGRQDEVEDVVVLGPAEGQGVLGEGLVLEQAGGAAPQGARGRRQVGQVDGA